LRDQSEVAADGIYSRAVFDYDQERDIYICPMGKTLTTTGRVFSGNTLYYWARKADCERCPLPGPAFCGAHRRDEKGALRSAFGPPAS
jgi:hypothetical protein